MKKILSILDFQTSTQTTDVCVVYIIVAEAAGEVVIAVWTMVDYSSHIAVATLLARIL